ncbi:efflux RND transporter periplasmic adaptor subunit [Rhodoferax saidenbachensis]|uniref:Efflux transporter periplasmic adaptor subunit n=1 Tax=Rhodoferax saidenbachensis TaxID=1484693 RepID=A0A1P8KBF9_9BURK|nr:efflux RND transporter periplasmic adaptor subunit [Rhodoferax saidenbachensis]APW43321.1 efflux transporter periplasmic adaptor subunit [Rhodoferax saidenbachensis]
MNPLTNGLTQRLKQLRPLTLSLIAAGVLAVGGLGLIATQSRAADGGKPAATAKPALTVSVAQAKPRSLPIAISANGSVTAWQEASVGAEANGLRVAELHAAIGDRVQRGQLLASFAAESVQADVALARASVAEATANAAEATANADRARAVQGTGALSAQQINQYLTTELAAKARVDSAKAQLDTQLLRLKHTRLEAPDNGIISARTATVGSVIGAGTEMFKLIRNGRLEWRAEVTSTELGRITNGTPVVVTAPGGAQMKGKVRMVAPTVDAATRNGLVYVDLSGPVTGANAATGAFKPGMFARGEFELGSSGALTVANTAVVVRDGFSYVYRIAADNRVSQIKVQTGRTLGDQIELLGGVKPEDRLVASGASFLSEGDLVKVVDSKPNVPSAPANPAQPATK